MRCVAIITEFEVTTFQYYILYLPGEIQERGVVLPFAPVVYKSLLSRLRADGITAHETTTPLN